MNNDELLFIDEEREFEEDQKYRWKILIVDDEEEVHSMTKMILKDLKFDNKKIDLISAYSGWEAYAILKEQKDIAVVLLDVVMETDDAGLNLVKKIREELENPLIRIVLRTGQPGQAPESQVIEGYDINDYKEKTELTRQKLFSTIIASLRSYQHVNLIESHRYGLEKVINASSILIRQKTLFDFIREVLFHLKEFTCNFFGSSNKEMDGVAVSRKEGKEHCFIGMGSYSEKNSLNELSLSERELVDSCFSEKKNLDSGRDIVTCYFDAYQYEIVYIVWGETEDDFLRSELLKIFLSNIRIAFHNFILHLKNMEERENQIKMQKKLLFRLNEVIGLRSKETGDHVERVGEFAKIIGEGCGMNSKELEMLQVTAPLHDVGKVGISDSILLKPAKLTKEEFDIIKKHTTIGEELLKDDDSQLLIIASLIAGQHHEKWNGKGYPRGLKGEDISLYGRICSICDVFDALISKRVYKEAWTLEEAFAEIKRESGFSFEPRLVDVFLKRRDEVVNIVNTIKGD